MYFPISGVECQPLLPAGAAFFISLLTSLGGISGAFLLLPFQISVLGYVQPGVSATNQVFNIIACPGGIWRFYRERRLLLPVALLLALAGLPGIFFGALIRVTLLPKPGSFVIFAALVMLYMAFILCRSAAKKTGAASDRVRSDARIENVDCSLRRLSFSFGGKVHSVSNMALGLLSLVIGMTGGIYGIGGGAMISPFLVSFFGLPVHAIAGATLCSTFLTSIGGILSYMLLARFWPDIGVFPDLQLGLLLGFGGMAGIYLGARLQKFVSPGKIKVLLAAILLATAAHYLLSAFA